MTLGGGEHREPDGDGSGAYGLDEPRPAPALPGSVVLGEDREEALDALCSDLLVQSQRAVGATGGFHLALGLSAVVERVVVKLMVDPKYRMMPWEVTTVWSVADPCVDPGDPARSEAQLRELLIEPAGMEGSQIVTVPAHLADACERGSARIREVLGARGAAHERFDACVLGCDPDWTTRREDPVDRLYAHWDIGGMDHVAMTSRVVDRSALVAIVGVDEAHWAHVDTVEADHERCGVAPVSGVLRWYLDGSIRPEGNGR
jgi:hypothetical protein